MEGGYQIIDLKNRPLSTVGTKIPGVYDLIEGTRKTLLIQNVVIESSGIPVELHDFFASPDISGSDFIIGDVVQKVSIIITGTDLVTGYPHAPITADMIPINNTLEVDEDYKLGVASV